MFNSCIFKILSLFSAVLLAEIEVKTESPDSSVKRLIFDNSEKVIVIDFEGPVIIDNIFLLKKINESDSSPLATLNNYVEEPNDYSKRVEKLKMADPSSKKYQRIYDAACCQQVKIYLDTENFNDETIYLIKLQPWNLDECLYTEEFVYVNGNFEHKSATSGSRWYASAWPWIAIGFIILCAILLLKILFC